MPLLAPAIVLLAGAPATGAPITAAIDTTADAWININCSVTTLNETCTLENYTVEVLVP